MNKLRRIDSDSVKSCDLVAVYTHEPDFAFASDESYLAY